MTDVKGLLKTFSKQYGKDIAWKGVKQDQPRRILTGWLPFDIATGGVPEGRVTILFGAESSLKTTFALKLIAEAQRKYPKRKAAFVDVEGHLDYKWAQTHGVDTDALVYAIPDNAEQAVDIACALLQADDISVVVFDSLAAMATQAELEKDTEESVMGRQGLAINRFYRKVTSVLGAARSDDGIDVKPTLIVINQVRANIGVMHGDPEKQPGGRAFQFVSSLTVRLNGKDVEDKKISKTLPALKEVSVIIRKSKVPIIAKKAVVSMALLPNPALDLQVGEVYAWNTLLKYLKSLDLLTQPGKTGWVLTNPATGEEEAYKTQEELQAKVKADRNYRMTLYEGLVNAIMATGDIIDAE